MTYNVSRFAYAKRVTNEPHKKLGYIYLSLRRKEGYKIADTPTIANEQQRRKEKAEAAL